MSNIFIKITKNLSINPYNGLKEEQGFFLEKKCLEIINSNLSVFVHANHVIFRKFIKQMIQNINFIYLIKVTV